MTPTGISLIIPAYNASRYLREAIDSALNQTVKPRQIIVVDDGSTDDTLEIARSYGDRLETISQPTPGRRRCATRPARASQPMIAFLDADDRYFPRKLQRQLRSLSGRPRAMLCICRACDFLLPGDVDCRRSVNPTPQFRPGQVGHVAGATRGSGSHRDFQRLIQLQVRRGIGIVHAHLDAGVGILQIDDVLVERRLHAANKTTNSKGALKGSSR